MKKIIEHFKQFELSVKYMHTDHEVRNFQSLMASKGISLPESYYEFINYFGSVFIMSEAAQLLQQVKDWNRKIKTSPNP
ncbi:hypothetical protein [Persicobacter psychrovividus]|uniref:Uncharacterized protein n=1 Tax=Persicobacter psychrovividus TaxID=387638 RepID=A0ABN6LCH5_9BACT|nr:hypothetical protein PEPS_28290 [Persicobacter psychrovividus]